MCIYICLYICMYIYTHICMYIYMYTGDIHIYYDLLLQPPLTPCCNGSKLGHCILSPQISAMREDQKGETWTEPIHQTCV